MRVMHFTNSLSSVVEFLVSKKTGNVIVQEKRRNGGRENQKRDPVIFKDKHSCLPPFLRSSCSMLLFQTLFATQMN
jgi:hypothetical protein